MLNRANAVPGYLFRAPIPGGYRDSCGRWRQNIKSLSGAKKLAGIGFDERSDHLLRRVAMRPASQLASDVIRPRAGRMARRTATAALRQGTAIVRVVTQTIVAAANDIALCANS